MLTLLAASLCVSAILGAISCGTRPEVPTNWPMMILAHLFWPVTVACVAFVALRERRYGHHQ